MKFKIERSKFLDTIRSVQNIVVGKGSLPVLQNVLIEENAGKLKFITTDLDLSIKTECEAEIIEGGKTTLPVKLLANAVSALVEGVVEVDIDSNELATISAGNAKFKIAGIPSGEFPKLPEDNDDYEYKMPQVTLKEMLRKVYYAASQDDTRRTLKGVFMSFKDSKLTMVATDGRRLALIENEFEFAKDKEKDIVLPYKTVCELQRSLNGEGDVTIVIQNTQIRFKLGEIQIYSKLIDDVYPRYTQVIPKETAEHVTVDRQLLIDALGRASVMTLDEAHSIKLIFSTGKLTVTSAVSDVGEARDEVPIKYAGEKVEIMFNPSYVIDPLKAIDDDEITININDGHSPAVIKCSIPFLYVLMPLRIS